MSSGLPSFSLEEVLAWTGGRLANPDQGIGFATVRVSQPSQLTGAGPDTIAFFFAREYQSELPTARPGILITAEPFVEPLKASGLPLWKTSAVIACPDPYAAMATLSAKFAETLSSVGPKLSAVAGVHPSATIDPRAEIGPDVTIGSHCTIEGGAKIGARVVLYPGVFVGPNATIDDDSVLFPHVTVYENSVIGARVRLHAGVVIGADGFGYAPVKGADGRVGEHRKIFHLGRVVIQDDVEIGANSCIDRGTIGDTFIGKSTKIDNLVQVGHNSHLSEGAIICGKVGIAGGSKIGRFAYVGGGSGVGNGAVVGDYALVGSMTGISKDVEPGKSAIGFPQREPQMFFRVNAILNRLATEKRKK